MFGGLGNLWSMLSGASYYEGHLSPSFHGLLGTQSICGLMCMTVLPSWTRADSVSCGSIQNMAFECPRAEVYVGVNWPREEEKGRGNWGDT